MSEEQYLRMASVIVLLDSSNSRTNGHVGSIRQSNIPLHFAWLLQDFYYLAYTTPFYTRHEEGLDDLQLRECHRHCLDNSHHLSRFRGLYTYGSGSQDGVADVYKHRSTISVHRYHGCCYRHPPGSHTYMALLAFAHVDFCQVASVRCLLIPDSLGPSSRSLSPFMETFLVD